MKRILILGGGASGIAAAISAAQQANGSAEIMLLEKNQRIAKKLLATGNGRCNFGNTSASIEKYFSRDIQNAKLMLDEIAEHSPEKWFADLGLLSRAEDERLYPYSNQAGDRLNLLLYWLERLDVKIVTEKSVCDIGVKGDEYWVRCTDGERIYANAVICALGGSAGPQFGTDGFGYELAKLCGCKIEPLYPCLVPLKCDKRQIQGLSGIRVKCGVSLLNGEKIIHSEKGEVQFTDYGLSGIAVMQLSGFLSPKSGISAAQASIDLFPDMDTAQLETLLQSRCKLFGQLSLSSMTDGLLNRRIALAVLKRMGGETEKRKADTLDENEIKSLAKAFKDWRFDNLEQMGWQQAQTTGGGISLWQIDSKSFEMKGCERLYFVGEMLDCAGFCGGYNLHWAFGSGITAGVHAAKSVAKSSKKREKRK